MIRERFDKSNQIKVKPLGRYRGNYLETKAGVSPNRLLLRIFTCNCWRVASLNTCIVEDMRVLASMLEDGEQEVWANQHYDPSVFKGDPGGIVYQR